MRPWLLPSALADVVAGAALGGGFGTLESPAAFLLALASTACLYSAGMVLNDVADLTEDRRLAPARPLPSGRVSPGLAALFGLLLLSAGVMVAPRNLLQGMPLLLAALILFYDFFAKGSLFLGGTLLASCRVLNLGMGFFLTQGSRGQLPPAPVLAVAACYGVYVFFTVWHGMLEVRRPKPRLSLAIALIPCIAGSVAAFYLEMPLLALLASLPSFVAVLRIRRGQDRVARRTGALLRGLSRYAFLLALGMAAWLEAALIALAAYALPPLLGRIRWS
ncbi:MAG: UbiA family prenyltransferase [Planctomycetota bacterium]